MFSANLNITTEYQRLSELLATAGFSVTPTNADITESGFFRNTDAAIAIYVAAGYAAVPTSNIGEVAAGDTLLFDGNDFNSNECWIRSASGTPILEFVTGSTGYQQPGPTGPAGAAGGGVTSVSSANGALTVTSPTTAPVLTINSAPILTTARTIGGVSFNGSANITVASATGGFTVSGGVLAIGANPITSGSGTLTLNTTGTITVPNATDTLVGKATTDTFTNKTFDTAATGNALFINGVAVTGFTGSGPNIVRATNPILTTPDLGTPTSLVGTNITGTAAAFTAGHVTTNANLTGDVTSVGNAATVVKINGTSLAGLATGILKNTTTTGVPSIATGSDLPAMTATVGGAVPTPPNNTTTFLRGDGTFTVPPGSGGTVTSISSANGALTVSSPTTTPVLTVNSAPILTTARNIGGVSFDGSASIVPQTIQSINEATDTTCFPLFISASGSQSLQPLNNVGFVYNSNANALTATTFVGALTGTASGNLVSGGALGTPSSGTLTNCTFPTLNQNTSGSAASLSISGQSGLMTVTGLASTNRIKTVRDAADTILELGGSYTPSGTWTSLTLVTPILGTPTSGTLTNCTGLPVAGITSSTSTALGVGSLELGAASDTTLARVSAGVISVEGATVPTLSATSTWTAVQTIPQVIAPNNAITASGNAATVPVTSKVNTVTNNSAATLTITLTTSGAVDRQACIVCVLDFSAVAQTITWVNTENSTVSAPTTSNGSTTLPLTVGFMYNAASGKFRCIASA